MNVLLLFDRRATCPECRIRRDLIAHLQGRNDPQEVFSWERVSAEDAADKYNARACAHMLLAGQEDQPLEYDFSTRSDAPCRALNGVAFERADSGVTRIVRRASA